MAVPISAFVSKGISYHIEVWTHLLSLAPSRANNRHFPIEHKQSQSLADSDSLAH